MELFTPKQNVLLLMANGRLFRIVKELLEEKNCEVWDDFERNQDLDFIILDSFFFHSGTPYFLKETCPLLPRMLVISPNPNDPLPEGKEEFFDTLRIPRVDNIGALWETLGKILAPSPSL